MAQTVSLGIAAGIATAIFFSAILTGAPLAMLLYLLTPLPAIVAGLMHGHWATATATAACALLLLVVVSPALALSYAAIFGVPGWLLVRFALGEDGGTAPAPSAGRILALGVVFAGTFGAANVLLLGPDEATYRQTIGQVFDFYQRQLGGATGEQLPADQSAIVLDILMRSLPAIAAVSWLFIEMFSLWLGGRIARAHGSLARGWPDLAALQLPDWTLVTFMASLVVTYLGSGQTALVGSAFMAAHGAGYLAQGLALAHRLSVGQTFRTGMLIALYVALIVAGYYMTFLLITVALAAPVLGLDQRRPTPPTNTPSS